MEDTLRQIATFPLVDQDRAAAIIKHSAVGEWLIEPKSATLLVHANSRRHEAISSTSVACAMLIHILSDRLPIITLYWFCGSHIRGPDGNALGMMRSLICQLLDISSFAAEYNLDHPVDFDGQDLGELLVLFKRLVWQLRPGTAVFCIIDGISYYEGSQQSIATCTSIRKIVKLMEAESPILKLLITSPTRTSHIHHEPDLSRHLVLVEIPQHVNGPKQGLNHRMTVKSTERRVRRLSESLGPGGYPK